MSAAYKTHRRRQRLWAIFNSVMWLAFSIGAGWGIASALGVSNAAGALVGLLAGEGWAGLRQLRKSTHRAQVASTLGFTVDVEVNPMAHELCAPWAELWRSSAEPETTGTGGASRTDSAQAYFDGVAADNAEAAAIAGAHVMLNEPVSKGSWRVCQNAYRDPTRRTATQLASVLSEWIMHAQPAASGEAAARAEPDEALLQSRRFHLPSLQAVLGRGLIWDDSAKSAAPWLRVHGLFWGTPDGRDEWKTQPDLCLILDEGWLELWLTPIVDAEQREQAREEFVVGANMGGSHFWPTGAKLPVLIAEYPLGELLGNTVLDAIDPSGWETRRDAQHALLTSVGFGADKATRHMTVHVRAWD